MSQRARIALFDLDHTLLPIDSDFTWTSFTNVMGWTHPQEVQAQNDAFYADYREGRLDMHAYIRFVTQAVRDLTPQQLHAVRERYVREFICPHVLPPALDLLQRHRDAGDTLLITTATNRFIAGAVGAEFGFSDDQILATELQYTADGRISGEMAGLPNLREGKVHKLQHWLAARRLEWDGIHLTFYSDSLNDLPLLEKAQEPVATNPDAALRALAADRGWRILDLFPTR